MLPPGIPEEPLAPCEPADPPAEGVCPPGCWPPVWPADPLEDGNGDALPGGPLEDGDELPPDDPLEDGDGDELPEEPPEGGNGDELPDEPLLPDELGACMLLELHPARLSITVEMMIIAGQQSVILLMSFAPRAKPCAVLYRRW
jgi:hypothetical protein